MSTQPEESWVPSDAEFGARLALVRQRFAWNLKEAALACNLSANSWREWELFGRLPRNLAEVSARISARTNVDEYWLLTGKTTSRPRPDNPGDGTSLVGQVGLEPTTDGLCASAGHGADNNVVPLRPGRFPTRPEHEHERSA